jgi:hypothetical protein
VACDEDRNRILNGASSGDAEGSESAGGRAGGGVVAAVEVDGGVAERGEPGDVGGVGVVPVSGEVVERGLGVDGLPEHNYVDHDPEGVELVFLSDLVVLA